ncbi:sialate O-acetylesterase [Gemmatimonadota bacterium]
MRQNLLFTITPLILALTGINSPVQADVTLPSLFTDHMVIQRDARVTFWGWADPGERVTVALGTRSRKTSADAAGTWEVTLPPIRSGGDPLTLIVTGDNTLVIEDVLVGEVWICSGQSNMWWPIRSASDPDSISAAADFPAIRMFTVTQRTELEPQENCEGSWEVCTPETVKAFSAVGYHFARILHQEIDCPVGMIHTSWGGTPAEAWTSIETLQSDPSYDQVLDRREADGTRPQHRAATLWNAMIAPLIPFTIKGVIWYQGEANVPRAAQYRTLFPDMIADWRQNWDQGAFPFYFVQLAPYRYGGRDPRAGAELRDAQRTALSIPNTGMAVTSDIGNPRDIHPRNKHDVGNRLALWALANDYGRDLVYSGPLYASMEIDGPEIRLSFQHSAGGLATIDGAAPTHFEIAGRDRKFQAAEARIEGDTVIVYAEQVTDPVAVRYAWRDDAEPNLISLEGLPASSFRTDNWPGITDGRK